MQAFLIPFEEMPQLASVREGIQKKSGFYEVSGVIDTVKPHLIYALTNNCKVKLVVTSDEERAKQLVDGCTFFEENVYYYPARDLLFYQSDIHSNTMTRERLMVVEALLSSQDMTVVTTIDALMNKVPSLASYQQAIFTICLGDVIDLEEMRKNLVTLGYEVVSQVEHPGEFSVRGGIVDLFPLTKEYPIRMELWGDEIDSLRYFEVVTQKSIEQIAEVTIYPAMELVLTPEEVEAGLISMESDAKELHDAYRKEMKTEQAHRIYSSITQLCEETREWGYSSALETHLNYFVQEAQSLLAYFPEDTVVILDEIPHLTERGQQVSLEFSDSMSHRLENGYLLPRDMDMLFDAQEIFLQLSEYTGIALATLDEKEKAIKFAYRCSLRVGSTGFYNGQFPLLVNDLKRFCRNKYRILLVCPSRTRAKHLAELLQDEDFAAFYTENYDHFIHPGEIMVCQGNISRGYEFSEVKFVLLSEQDIFGARYSQKKRAKRKYHGEHIASFSELSIGDYVVHENHGVGIYQGFEKIEVDHVMKDYIKIAYAKGGNLYIPATQFDMIQKYGSQDGKKPKLNVLGTQDWTNTKTRVRQAVGVVARDLVDLYAARQQNAGYVYGPDTVWQKEFEESFPYEETEGQLAAIEAVKADMMSQKIMDRLICGDVGYGKTEIAIRAAFKAVQEGKQVVYLVPTTILAQQHYNTFTARMSAYPVNVRLLCRFVSAAEQKDTIAGLKNGSVDIVIGTHRLLSKDVEYKDLGLLVIDEEQRFGVSHKEKIKQLKQNVDVISLSATPIPRTLHMSLIGIRDMSLLEEAPMDRRPIQTFVFEYNEEMIREAILRELARGGQVYYVYNRVNTIADVTARLEQLVPEAHIAYAHGKMSEAQIEKIMYGFINQEIDVLVATTIIEIGIDISNVNTMIIQDAEKLGLSQLYQLRGRVGRSNRTAYAFLMYKRDRMLKETAEKRLAAIKEFTDLGSGFKIAMRDLEIRGAGNLLGKEQHGNMAAVGYDLYCKMLNEAVLREKGEVVEENFETTIDLEIDAYLPENYVPSETQRLDIYKRIALIENEEQRDDILDELIDRFAEPPKPVLNLLMIAMLRVEAHRAFLVDLSQKNGTLIFTFFERAPVDATLIAGIVEAHAPYVKFEANPKRPRFCYEYHKNSRIKQKDVPQLAFDFVKELQSLIKTDIIG